MKNVGLYRKLLVAMSSTVNPECCASSKWKTTVYLVMSFCSSVLKELRPSDLADIDEI